MMTNIELKHKLSKIKAVLMDVDGVMTDGSLTFFEDGCEIKTYNAKDGQGIVMLNKAGILTGIITARDNGTVRHRFKNLGMTKLYQGEKNKEKALDEFVKEFNVDYSEIAYMGDDLPDICVLKKVGLACCPKDAVADIVEISEFVSQYNGGRGAVRELCDLVLKSQNKYGLNVTAV